MVSHRLSCIEALRKKASIATIASLLVLSVASVPALDAHANASATSMCAELDASTYTGSAERFTYRCEFLHELKTRGLKMSDPTGTQVLAELLRPYETVLHLRGEVSIPKSALQYLFDEFPDTARLVNFYTKSNYLVVYTNSERSQFFATNNRNMEATFDIIDRRGANATTNFLLFENGQAKLVIWRFVGKSIVELNLEELGRESKYEIELHIFTSSRAFHFFFESVLFKYLMNTIFKRILGDIETATQQLAETNDSFPTINPNFIDDLLTRLR